MFVQNFFSKPKTDHWKRGEEGVTAKSKNSRVSIYTHFYIFGTRGKDNYN